MGFGILAREIFNPMYGLFQPAGGKQSTFHPNPMSYVNPDHLSFFTFIGRVVGKALYDNVTLEAYFTRSFYKHMLQKPVTTLTWRRTTRRCTAASSGRWTTRSRTCWT